MQVTPKEFAYKIDSVLEKTADDLLPVMASVALQSKALFVRRIQREGFTARYSGGKIPVYFLEGFTGKNGITYPSKEINKKGLAFLKKKEKEQQKENKENKTNFRARVSWAEFRKAQGLQVRFVDLTYSGKMFQNWRVPNARREGLKVIGQVGATDDETAKKLKWNSERYKDFGRIDDEDKKIIIEQYLKPQILEILKNNFRKQ